MNVHAGIHDATSARRDELAERGKFHPDAYTGQSPIKVNGSGTSSTR
ncbi:MAG: hypothetical protein ACK4MV_14320 [Beijerinckiaceae bacterium]